jgi:hypothetical protein
MEISVLNSAWYSHSQFSILYSQFFHSGKHFRICELFCKGKVTRRAFTQIQFAANHNSEKMDYFS